MWQRFKRVPEKDEEINLVFDNLGPQLLIAPKGSAFKFHDFEAQLAFQDFSRCAGGIYPVMSQKVAVIFGPFHQVGLFIIVCHESYLLIMLHWNFSVCHNALCPPQGRSIVISMSHTPTSPSSAVTLIVSR